LAGALGLATLILPGIALAGTVTINLDTGRAVWRDINTGSSDYCEADGASATFNVEDGSNSAGEDAFDGGAAVFINDLPYDPQTLDSDATDVTGELVTITDLDVQVNFHAPADATWLRQTITLSNPTAAAINAAVYVSTNMGADSGTTVTGLGDGWFAVADDATSNNDVPVTFLLHGVAGSEKAVVVNGCGGTTPIVAGAQGSDDFVVTFPENSIAAGQTVHYVLFYALPDVGDPSPVNVGPAVGESESILQSIAFGENATDANAYAAGLFDGFTSEQLDAIANWNITALPSTGMSVTPVLGAALGLAFAGAFIAAMRRRAVA
jgi:hypothetical protein